MLRKSIQTRSLWPPVSMLSIICHRRLHLPKSYVELQLFGSEPRYVSFSRAPCTGPSDRSEAQPNSCQKNINMASQEFDIVMDKIGLRRDLGGAPIYLGLLFIFNLLPMPKRLSTMGLDNVEYLQLLHSLEKVGHDAVSIRRKWLCEKGCGQVTSARHVFAVALLQPIHQLKWLIWKN